ncbi:MAG: hypothetical protein ACFB6R_17460 [Alphaproteobacteria bacterium]
MNETQAASNRPVWAATALAFAAGAVILVIAVLPAEYGVDPTGLGARLGLTGLAETAPLALAPQDREHHRDAVSFTLDPFESLEYKYALKKGAGMLFSWHATGPLAYDFHSEPEGASEGVAESFDKDKAAKAHGAYVAPFTGIHGWFWENRTAEPVTVTLNATGFFDRAITFRDGFERPRAIPPAAASSDDMPSARRHPMTQQGKAR